jgi:hypothetical protein
MRVDQHLWQVTRMIVYFDLQPEYRKRLAELLGSTEDNLEPFYKSLESEVAWHLALGGLRESKLTDEQILGQLKELSEASNAMLNALEKMSPDVYGWLIDHAPIGLDYQMPFRVVQKPLLVIRAMTTKSVSNFQGRNASSRRSTSADFVRKIAGCCEKVFGSRPDLNSDLFYGIVEIMFESLGIAKLKDIRAIIKEAILPPKVILPDHDEDEDEQTSLVVPENYLNAQRKGSS